MTWRRAVALLLVAATMWLTAGPAAAHDALASSSPRDDQTVARVPAAVVLTFAEPALAMGTRIVVTGPAGEVQQGPPKLVDDTVTQPLRGDAPAGDYTVDWRVTSADGHPVSGSFTFAARAAGVGTAAAPAGDSGAEPTGVSGGSAWVWVVVGLLAVGTAASSVLLWRRSRLAPRAVPGK